MESNRKKLLLEKLLNNQCSREELEELLNFRGSREFDEKFGEVFDREWEKLNDLKVIDPLRGDEIFYDIISQNKRNGGSSNISMLYKAAAVFLLLVLFSGLFYWYVNFYGYTTQTTGLGKIKKIELPDGSLVTLNANSSVTYKKHWSKDETRILTLQGEAFFNVTHQSNHQKFLVEAENIKVEVLGTEFNVLARERGASVVLKSGKVKLEVNGKEEIIMQPGQLVEVLPNAAPVKKNNVNAEAYVSWKNRLLIFESASLSEISKIIEDTYGVEIVFGDSTLTEEKFTGVFPTDENLDVLFKMLSKTYEFEITKKDDKVYFNR